MVDINLLPWRAAYAAYKKKQFCFKFVLSMILLLCFFSGAHFFLNYQQQIIDNQIVEVKLQLQKKRKIPTLTKNITQLTVAEVELIQKDQLMTNALFTLLDEDKKFVYLTQMNKDIQQVIVSGIADSMADFVDFSTSGLLKHQSIRIDELTFKNNTKVLFRFHVLKMLMPL